MAIKKTQRGFALFVAVIFMMVMLTFGLTLGALAFKQETLASSALESQYAFYAADAGLECGLYADQQQSLFAYPATSPGAAPALTCHGVAPVSSAIVSYSASQWVLTYRFPYDNNRRCADITVYKYSAPQPGGITTIVYSQGYDVSCSTVSNPNGARIVSRGLYSSY